ncbi:MAG: hypothetical protein WCD36_00305 [Rhodanobacteraceae bacterium]
MSSTIELLEDIGGNASLRHASPEVLEQTLAEMQASEGLRESAISGERRPLFREFGPDVNQATQVQNNPNQNGFEDDEDEDGDDDGSRRREDDDHDSDR